MLRALDPVETQAYRVPWRIDRTHGTHPLITNAGPAPLELVRAFIAVGQRSHETQRWGRVATGETVEICLCEHDPADVIVTIAWFRPEDGVEYVWRFVL
jgi:hypothetical protein